MRILNQRSIGLYHFAESSKSFRGKSTASLEAFASVCFALRLDGPGPKAVPCLLSIRNIRSFPEHRQLQDICATWKKQIIFLSFIVKVEIFTHIIIHIIRLIYDILYNMHTFLQIFHHPVVWICLVLLVLYGFVSMLGL